MGSGNLSCGNAFSLSFQLPDASMFTIAVRAFSAMSCGTVTCGHIFSRLHKIFSRVVNFMFGQIEEGDAG